MRKPKKAKQAPRSIYAFHPFTLPEHRIMEDDVASRAGLSDRLRSITLEDGVFRTLETMGVFRLSDPPLNMPNAQPLDADAQLESYFYCTEKAKKTVDAIQHDPARLYAMAKRCMGHLAGLGRHHGNAQALWLFADLAGEIGQGLSDMMFHDRKAFVPIARTKSRWPMMRSTHPLNCDPDSWLSDMALGTAYPICLDKHSKWKPGGYTATYATRLYEHLEQLRGQRIEIDGKPIKEVLPEFSRDTAPAWWEYAWRFLLYTYPEPEKVSELERLVTAPTKRSSPGRMKQAIQDVLKARFYAIAKP